MGMEYTVQQLARLAGITPRTLRYYDRLGLLKPARISGGGYRIYGTDQVDRLQQILFYRELDVGLDKIQALLSAPAFDALAALREHRRQLKEKQVRLARLLENVELTIAAAEGDTIMSDDKKFTGFKRELVEKNEREYGEEVRRRYGREASETANRRVMDMSREEHDRLSALGEEIHAVLSQAMDTGDPAGELGQAAARLHGEWLSAWWPAYDPEAHANLACMYVEDERFRAYYDSKRPGAAVFLRDAVLVYTRRQES